MLTAPSNQIPEHLAIRTSRRIECRLKWPFAALPERPACKRIADLEWETCGDTTYFLGCKTPGGHPEFHLLTIQWLFFCL